MNRFTKCFATLLMLCAGISGAFAQTQNARVKASDFAKWKAVLQTGAAAGSNVSLTVAPCYFTPNNGARTFSPFVSLAPITINDSNAETVTPTAVGTPSYISGIRGGCEVTVTVTLSNSHNSGVLITSGDGGIAEAAASDKSGVVVIDGPTGTNTAIGSIPVANPFVSLEDDRGPGGPQLYTIKPTTLTLISAGSAPTNTGITGSLTSGAYTTSYVYVDMLGGISLPATDSSQTGTVTGVSIAAPAATTGAVGWIPYITAAGGSNGTEIMVPVTNSVCAVSSLETVIPACKLSSAATVTANPSSTAKEPAFGTAHTTFAWQPVNASPLNTPLGPIQTSFGPFSAVSTVTAASNADVAQFYIPAGTLNYLGKVVRVCAKANGTNGTSSVATWKLQLANQYGQSPITAATVAFAAQTGAVTTNICFDLNVAATGSSGNFWASSIATENINGGPTPIVASDVTTAVSSNIDLTKGIYASINLGATTANITSVTVNSLRVIGDPSN